MSTLRKKPELKSLKPSQEQIAEYAEYLATETHKALEATKRSMGRKTPEHLVDEAVQNTIEAAVRDCLGVDDTWERLEINRGPVRDLVEKFIQAKLPQIEARVDAELDKMWKARGAQIMKAAGQAYIDYFRHAVTENLKYAAHHNALKEVNEFLEAQGLEEVTEQDIDE